MGNDDDVGSGALVIKKRGRMVCERNRCGNGVAGESKNGAFGRTAKRAKQSRSRTGRTSRETLPLSSVIFSGSVMSKSADLRIREASDANFGPGGAVALSQFESAV